MDLSETLAKLVAIPSPTGQEQALASFCAQQLAAAGFQLHWQPVAAGRSNLLAEAGQGEQALLLYAHLDTVPPAPGMLQPFCLRQAGDHLLGLGVSDMKGGLALILELARCSRPETLRLKIALTVDEEAWSAGAWTLLHSAWLDDVCLILVPELSVDSSELTLGLGRRGAFSYQLCLQGETAHAAVQGQGCHAILEMARLLNQLDDFPLVQDPLWGTEALLVRQIAGAEVGLSVPASCEAVLTCLVHPGSSVADWQTRLQDFFQARTPAQVMVRPLERPTPMAPAYWQGPQTPFLDRIQQLAKIVHGRSLPEVMGVSVADENILALSGRPVFSLAPVGGLSHQAGEWLSAASLSETFTLYQALLVQATRWLTT